MNTVALPLSVTDLGGLLDDAAIFPPGNAPLRAAVAAHLARRTTWAAPLIGSLVVRAATLPDLTSALDIVAPAADGDPPALSVVTGPGDVEAVVVAVVDAVTADPRLRLHAVEVTLEPGSSSRAGEVGEAAAAALPDGVLVFLEPGWTASLDTAIVALASAGHRLKLRCGGLTAEAFPPVEALAEAVTAAVAHGVPFKATAGLHHAVRHTDPVTGFEHHGFANLLVAAARAEEGADVVRALLDERDPAVIAGRLAALGAERVRATLATRFGSFGTCDLGDPIGDLIALRVLAAPDAAVGA